MNDTRYSALDGLRGVAVLLVFCVHAAGNAAHVALGLDLDRAYFLALPETPQQLLYWLWSSHHGVFLFFVLSGFLIGRMWWPRPAMPYRTFAWRRTLRIYPAFLLSFLASLAFAWSSGTWTPPDVARVLGNLLLLVGAPSVAIVPFNIVTWSLFYEMSFYLAFPACALAAVARGPDGGRWLWSGGVALPAIAAAFGADQFVLCWSLLFTGVALAVHERPVRAFAARMPTAAIVAFYLASTTLALTAALPPTVAILWFGGAALLVIAKALSPDNAIAAFLSLRPLRALGKVSYSFYLVHWMLVVLVARAVAAQALAPLGATLAIFVGGFAVSAVAATVLWWLAERPYFAWVRR